MWAWSRLRSQTVRGRFFFSLIQCIYLKIWIDNIFMWLIKVKMGKKISSLPIASLPYPRNCIIRSCESLYMQIPANALTWPTDSDSQATLLSTEYHSEGCSSLPWELSYSVLYHMVSHCTDYQAVFSHILKDISVIFSLLLLQIVLQCMSLFVGSFVWGLVYV